MTIAAVFISLFISSFTVPADTVMLAGVDIVSSPKMPEEGVAGALAVTTVGRVELENRHINTVKELSSVAPNFYQPDYGSRMTSSVYMRGYGSRIDQPTVGLTVDQVPVLNKNNYDFELFDVASVQIIRGAQSTFYGRNTAAGAINITTLSPLVFQGKRLSAEYGSENNIRVKAAHYAAPTRSFGWSAAMYYNHSDGFFTNSYTGDKCDGGDNAAVRLRVQWLPSEKWSIDNSLSAGYDDEGGWGYRQYDSSTGTLAPVAYNHPCSYRRFTVSDALVIKRFFRWGTLSSVTGYRYLDDKMRIDNDFTVHDYFTLEQTQREHSVTQEFILKSGNERAFKWTAGVFGFYKHLDMDAPVNFREYGIEQLILKNANNYFYSALGNNRELSFKENDFTIHDNFTIPTFGVAAFLQAGYRLGCFDFEAGLRFDYESSRMDYDTNSLIHYTTYKNSVFYSPLNTVFAGRRSVDAFEVLPSLSVTYRHRWGDVYASVRKGFKAGGFNTQLFSDILQNKMIAALVSGANTQGSGASSVVYNPEENWNYELGTHLDLFSGRLGLSAALFYIACTDQQLTVMPVKGAGRMMSNAGESHSYGAEFSAELRLARLTLTAAYGYTHATFDEYISDGNDYSGCYMPYAPRETVSLNAAYNINVPRSFANRFILNVGWNGFGRIYWDEANTLSQPFYGLLSASLMWEKGYWGASLWGKNLLARDYRTFYFRSIGNDFFSMGKPRTIGVSLHINL